MADGQTTSQKMVERRRRILLAYLVTWGIWQASRIVQEFFSKSPVHPHWWSALITVQLASWLGWTVSLICLVLFGKDLTRKPALAAVISDEFWAQARLKAAGFAFGAVMAAQVGIVLLLTGFGFAALSAQIGADISIFVGVTAFIGAFLVLERE